MINEVIVIGDLKLRDGAALDEYERLGERMYEIVSNLPGFQSVKTFKADDGEQVTLFRFSSEQALEAWRTHPEHVETMKRGHAEFYASGFLQICKVIREVGPFEHTSRASLPIRESGANRSMRSCGPASIGTRTVV
jgi:heme-degrading monooxygenase HmoA